MFKRNPIVGRLVDIFAASDGGLELVQFKTNVETIAEYADTGNPNAIKMQKELEQALAVIDKYTK